MTRHLQIALPTQSTFLPFTRALRLDTFEHKPIVAFVGGGGKTSAMFSLARELVANGKRVVTTTTTRLFASQRAESPAWCGANGLEELSGLLDRYGQCLVTAADATWADGKARGIAPALVHQLATREDVDAVLIEADGSRRRPFKAPAEHEPVIPDITTHVVALVGADVFGKPLNAATVHRPERIMALADVREGEPVTPALVAQVLAHPDGGWRGVPEAAAFIPFINKVEDEQRAKFAYDCADLLLAHTRVQDVVIGSLHHGQILRSSRPAAVILAAGMAKRFGETKQLLIWRGEALVAHVAKVALAVCEKVLVVTGHEAEKVKAAVAHLPVEVELNPEFATGQGSSVAAGARALLGNKAEKIGEAFFMLADQPLITPAILQQLRRARNLSRMAVPRYQGKRGNPVLFDVALLPALTQAEGDIGGRVLFERYANEIAWVEMDEVGIVQDIDRQEDWEQFLNKTKC